MKHKYEDFLAPHDIEYGVSLKVADLRLDPQAQRGLDERRAQRLADGLVPEAIGSIIVSKRENGELYIVDGQHRWRALQLAGIENVTAEVHKGLTQQAEAVLFLIKNRESAKPNKLAEYKVGVTAGLPPFVDIENVLSKRGLALGTNASGNTIAAVARVIEIAEQYGADVLERTLIIAEQAWGRSGDSFEHQLLIGLATLLARHGDEIDDEDLVRKLAKQGPLSVVSQITLAASAEGTRGTGTGSRKIAAYRVMVAIYNKSKSKHKLVPR